MSYRCSLPISRISRKPRVVSSAVGAPVRSMIALVTSVVPCTRVERSPTPTPASRHRSTSPRSAPSAGSGVVVRTLCRRSSPVVSLRRTKSVKVPPMSRPTRNPRIEDPNLCSTPRFDRPLGVRILWPQSLFLLQLISLPNGACRNGFRGSRTITPKHRETSVVAAALRVGRASRAPIDPGCGARVYFQGGKDHGDLRGAPQLDRAGRSDREGHGQARRRVRGRRQESRLHGPRDPLDHGAVRRRGDLRGAGRSGGEPAGPVPGRTGGRPVADDARLYERRHGEDRRRPAEIASAELAGTSPDSGGSEGRSQLMRSRTVLESALILLVVAALAGSLVFSTSAAPRRGGVLRVAEIGEPLTLDTVATTADLTSIITLPIFEELFTFDAGFRVQPLLAESYTQSKDGLTYTFVLRKNVTFHNGKEMTAEDVVASLERWGKVSPRGASVYKKVESTTASDKYTVALKLKEPFAPLLSFIALPNGAAAIMPKEVVDSTGTGPLKQYIGTGPYKFAEWIPDRHVKLVRFDTYAARSEAPNGYAGRREALADEVFFYPVSQVATRIAGVQSGDYDLADRKSTRL